MSEPVLDWRPNWDEKSNRYLIAQMDCYAQGAERRNIMRLKDIHLDQGREGACTGFGAEHVRALGPYQQETFNGRAHMIYTLAKSLDEWAGEDYEGSSVNGAMKAERQFGFITEWRWAKSMAELRHALSYHGAVEAGTWWYTGMMTPDDRGFVHVSGGIAGGHAYAIAGYKDIDGKCAYRIENSWGPGWGDNGGCWIWEDELQQLMDDQGEFAVPKKVRM